VNDVDEKWVPLPGFAEAIQSWGNLRLIDFNVVHRLELLRTKSGKGQPFDLFVSLEHTSHEPLLRMNLKFTSVNELEFGDSFRQIFLSLRDISSRGWEDTFYEVWSDDQRIFLCRDVDLLSVEQLVD
jgi:hypothetical protein